MLKLVVQPLVENAIFHGIMHKSEESGTIRITGRREGGTLCLEIRDDGVGMPEQTARDLLAVRPAGEELHGYGVRNIHERLRLRFGPGFGLGFRSLQGSGTTVTVRIPAA
jgi:two-component system sensor histidine kinase YesM